jgi:hypothetical protein
MMITGQQQPLTIAASILNPATIEAVRRSPSFHLQGWKILDRWAINSPQQLRDLETQGEVILLGRLLEQQTIEHQALSRASTQRQEGLTDHEILATAEIRTEL